MIFKSRTNASEEEQRGDGGYQNAVCVLKIDCILFNFVATVATCC